MLFRSQEDILSAEPFRTDGDDARDAEYPVYKIAIVAAAAVIVIVILLRLWEILYNPHGEKVILLR